MSVEKIAQSVLMTALMRLIVVVLLPVFMLVGSVMLTRSLNASDEIKRQVADGAVQAKLLEQAVKFGFDATKADVNGIRIQLADHEGRIRGIERDPRPARP